MIDKQALAVKVPLFAITRKQRAFKELARLLEQARAQKATHQYYATKAREGTFLFRGGRERKAREAADAHRQLRELAAEKAHMYERTFGPGKIRGTYRETRAKVSFDEKVEKLANLVKAAKGSSFTAMGKALLSGGVKSGKRMEYLGHMVKKHPGWSAAAGVGGFIGARKLLGGGGDLNVTHF